MNKKFFITLATIFSIILFGITYSFAGNNMGEDAVEGVRNFVGGAENVVEDTAKNVGEGIRTGVTDVKDAAQDTTHDMTRDNRNNSNYNATRTSATTNYSGNSFLNMGATAWSLLIIAILGIITVALVWYYGKQNEINVHHNHNNDDNY